MRLLTTLALGALALVSTVQATEQTKPRPKDYDICVIGAGAGGTAAAVYGTYHGYSVLVMDVQRNLGGHCDTYVRPPGSVPAGSKSWIDTGVAQLADTHLINKALDPDGKGPTRWSVNTKKYVDNFVTDSQYLQGINIPEDKFTTQAGIYVVDETSGAAAGPAFGQSQLPDFSDPVNAKIFNDLRNLTSVVYPWLDNGELTGPVPDELLVPFAQFMEKRGWTASDAMINLFTSILWYAVAMDKFENLPTVYALRFLAPTPQLLFAGKDFWYSFNGGCQRLYDNIYEQLLSKPYNNILVNTTVTSIVRPKSGGLFDFLIKPKITVKGFTLGVDKRGAQTNTSFTHTCGSLIFGMPAVPASLSAIGFEMDPVEKEIFGTVKSHGYFGGAVESTGRAIQETLSNDGLYNILHVNFQEPPFRLSPGDPTWISLQGNYGASSPSSISLLAGFSSNDIPQRQAQAIMQAQLNAHLTQSIDGGVTPPVLDTAQIVDFHAHRYQARPATSSLNRTYSGGVGWYGAIKDLQRQGYRNTYWTGATVNFPLHHVCMNEAYNLIQSRFPNKCTPSFTNFINYIICLAQGRKVDWKL